MSFQYAGLLPRDIEALIYTLNTLNIDKLNTRTLRPLYKAAGSRDDYEVDSLGRQRERELQESII